MQCAAREASRPPQKMVLRAANGLLSKFRRFNSRVTDNILFRIVFQYTSPILDNLCPTEFTNVHYNIRIEFHIFSDVKYNIPPCANSLASDKIVLNLLFYKSSYIYQFYDVHFVPNAIVEESTTSVEGLTHRGKIYC